MFREHVLGHVSTRPKSLREFRYLAAKVSLIKHPRPSNNVPNSPDCSTFPFIYIFQPINVDPQVNLLFCYLSQISEIPSDDIMVFDASFSFFFLFTKFFSSQ